MTEEDWNALTLDERMKLGVARMLTWKACGQLVCTGMTEEDWNALTLDERMKLGVARMLTWKACGQLVCTGKTEEDWNAMSIKERARLGVGQVWTWKVCGQLVGEGMMEEDWNALTLDERMKLGAAAKFADFHKRLWNGGYGELRQFINENGHSQVPRENRNLQDWVSYQKKAYKNGTMSLERKKLMDEIGDFSGDDGPNAVLGGMLDKHTGGSQVIPESLDELDVTEDSFTSNDVLMGYGVKNLPGNLVLQAAISNHMPDDLRGSTQWSDPAKLVINEIESLPPPGRFLELKPGNRCFCTLNRDRVIELIKWRFEENKKNKKTEKPGQGLSSHNHSVSELCARRGGQPEEMIPSHIVLSLYSGNDALYGGMGKTPRDSANGRFRAILKSSREQYNESNSKNTFVESIMKEWKKV
jgi:hypothetical protein